MNRYNDTRDLSELRLQLVECARSLRHYRDEYDRIKAECEQSALDNGKAGGKNAEERARSLTMALSFDSAYCGALAMLRDAEYAHERAEALVKCAEDERRAAEWQIRAKLADGLFRRQVQSDDRDPAGDSAYDDISLEVVLNRLASMRDDRQYQYRDVAREMLDAYNYGMADRVNGAGLYEDDLDF